MRRVKESSVENFFKELGYDTGSDIPFMAEMLEDYRGVEEFTLVSKLRMSEAINYHALKQYDEYLRKRLDMPDEVFEYDDETHDSIARALQELAEQDPEATEIDLAKVFADKKEKTQEFLREAFDDYYGDRLVEDSKTRVIQVSKDRKISVPAGQTERCRQLRKIAQSQAGKVLTGHEIREQLKRI